MPSSTKKLDAAEIIKTVPAAEGWIKNPLLTWPEINLDNVKLKLLKTHECDLTCLNPECNRKFATVAERNCQMHISHTRLNKNSIEEESKPFACPIASCNLRYHRKGWLIRHIAQCPQASEEATLPAPAPAISATKNKTTMPTSTPFKFKCPFVQRHCQQEKM